VRNYVLTPMNRPVGTQLGANYQFTDQQLADDLGFSLKPPKSVRKAFRSVQKAVTLKRVLTGAAIAAGAVVAGPAVLAVAKGAGGLVARGARGLVRRGGSIRAAQVNDPAGQRNDARAMVSEFDSRPAPGPVPAPMIDEVQPQPLPPIYANDSSEIPLPGVPGYDYGLRTLSASGSPETGGDVDSIPPNPAALTAAQGGKLLTGAVVVGMIALGLVGWAAYRSAKRGR
jgi:hypothetical protein